MAEYKILIESTDQTIEGSLDPNDIQETTDKNLKNKILTKNLK